MPVFCCEPCAVCTVCLQSHGVPIQTFAFDGSVAHRWSVLSVFCAQIKRAAKRTVGQKPQLITRFFPSPDALVCLDRIDTSQALTAPVAWVHWGGPADSRHIWADECRCAVWSRRLIAWPCQPRPYGVQAQTGHRDAPNFGSRHKDGLVPQSVELPSSAVGVLSEVKPKKHCFLFFINYLVQIKFWHKVCFTGSI